MGQWTSLRPVVAADYEYLFDLSMQQAARGRWRFFGATPSPEQFRQSLWTDVTSQFCVYDSDNRRVGLCTAYRADMRNGHLWVAAMFDDDRHPTALEGAAIFVQYLFDSFPLRKIYCELPESVEADVRSAFRRVATEEGRLRDHMFWQGRYWDWIYISITRDRWAKYVEMRQKQLPPQPGPTAADGPAA